MYVCILYTYMILGGFPSGFVNYSTFWWDDILGYFFIGYFDCKVVKLRLYGYQPVFLIANC